MRILLVSDYFLPSFGGVERHVYTLARYLAEQGFEVTVLTKAEKTDDSGIRSIGIDVMRKLKFATHGHTLENGPLYIRDCFALAKTIDRECKRFDIVHYHGIHDLFLFKVKSSKPLIATLHGIFPVCKLHFSNHQCNKRPSSTHCFVCASQRRLSYLPFFCGGIIYYGLYYKFMELSLRGLNKAICVSDYVKERLKFGFPSLNNLETVHNFIDIKTDLMPYVNSNYLFESRKYLEIPDNAKIILYSGRLSFEKGLLTLIQAFSLILKEYDNVFLVITGEGLMRQKLEHEASKNGKILFTGCLPKDTQLRIMCQSDVCVVPSVYPDACPTVILEAMALGLPLVATNVGGIPELIVDGKGGNVVRPNCPKDLADGIVKILNNDSLRMQIAKYNKKQSEKFDIKSIGSKIVELYKEATNGSENS